MDTKMDTRNLKHRKRQKKSKSGVDKRNNDVLVVPPDILKKLGISIGNTNFIHEITNNNNAGQNIGIVNNEATASISIPINNKKSNESSILETANLMKKSVFLSPTFISTVNNGIPGQVEIAKIKNYDSCETNRENLPIELPDQITQKGKRNKNGLTSNGYNNGDFSGVSIINNTGNLDKHNGVCEDAIKTDTLAEHKNRIEDIANKINCNNLTINETSPSDLKRNDELSNTSLGGNSHLTKDDIKATNKLNSIKMNVITIGQSGTDNNIISFKESVIYKENAIPVNNVNAEEELAVLIKHTDMEIEENEIRIVPEAENNLISFEKSTVQVENPEVVNNFISLKGLEIKVGQAEDKNNLIELEGLAMQVDQEEFQNNLISLEGCNIHLELPEDDNTLISLEKSAMEIEKADVDNIVLLEECEINMEDSNKLLSVEDSVVQMEAVVENNLISSDTDNLVTLADLAVQIEKGEIGNDWGSLVGCEIKTIDNENNLISLKDLGVKIVRTDIDKIQISSEPTETQRDEVDFVNNKIIREGDLEFDQVEKNNQYSIAPIEQAQGGNNINLTIIDQASYKDDAMEASLEIVCEDLKAISSKEYKDILTVKESKYIDSDITVNGQDITSVNINGDMSQISKSDIVKQIQASEIEVDNNNIVLNDCKNTENVCNGFSNGSSTLNEDSLKSEEDINYIGKKISLNKAIQKVNIISEEIIPASDRKDLKRSNSPIIKSLTPVPLNTIIAPKKAETRVGKSKRKAVPKLVHLPPEKVNASLTIKTSNKVTKEQECKESCENALTNKSLNKVDLKNNNESYGCVDNEASTNEQDIEDRISTTDHSRLLDLPKSVNEDKPCEAKEINDVSHLNGSILEDNYVKDSHYIDNELKSTNNDVEKIVDMKSSSDDNICKDTSISHPESKQNTIQVIEKKRKKNKKATEQSKNIVVNTTKDKEFCDAQINNILKSAKDSDANAHLDKVKEIAEYIKRYAHVYKDNKKEINRNIKKETNNIKDSINSKTNMTKSKLCIQGVEKPGGNKVEKKLSGNKVLKTYTRQKKQQKPSSMATVDKNDTVTCNIVDATETELNIMDISKSYKTQDFCLCYDFGHLDAGVVGDYDNSYEHIHFWLHNEIADLESILSIYNDDVEPVDRTKVDDLKICEVVEDNARIDNICWNYFLNYEGNGSKDVGNSSRIQAIDECLKEKSNKDVVTNIVEIDNSDSISKLAVVGDSVEHSNVSNEVDNTETASDVNMLKVDDVDVQSGSDVYEIITVVELVEGENEPEILETTELNSTVNTTIEETILNKNDTSDHIKQTPQQPQKECPKTDTPKEVKKDKKATLTTDNKKEDGNENKKTEVDKPTTSKTNRESKDKAAISEPESSKQNNRKRKLPVNDTSEEPSAKKDVKCGVCDKIVPQEKWEGHVVNKHGFIAWKAGQSFNFEHPDLTKKLQKKLETTGSLKCATCSMHTTKFKKYMEHVKVCSQHKESRRGSTSRNLVKCRVCHHDVSYLSWNEHIGKEHNYQAWIHGQEVLNTADEAAVVKHLQPILKANGGLTCYKCGLNRKRVKLYLSHVENCDGSQVNLDDTSMSVDGSTEEDSEPLSALSARQDKKTVTCGVCKLEVPVVQWTEHIAKEHNYLAWEDGATPLNVDDEEAVWNHLQEFIRQCGGLMCHKCGLNRKRVKMYLSHIKTCDGQGVNLDSSALDVSINTETDQKTFECGVCHAKLTVLEWNEHIGREHNYLAWKVGATPLDVNDEDAVKEHLLDIIRSCDGLICYKCGLNRKRVKLYLAHIQTCDGTNPQDTSTAGSNSMIEITIDGAVNIVKCGVCDQDVAESLWFEHIGREHKYLAWEHGQEPLNLDDEDAVKEHLIYISRHNNGLICNMCQVVKKYPKVFLQHVKDCTGLPILEESLRAEPGSIFDVSNVTTATVKCGVCQNEVNTDTWMTHMEVEHDYLAWLDGREPLDLEDSAVVQKHLIEVSKKTGGLKCKKCGLVRKYAKSYMHHKQSCWTGLSRRDLPVVNGNLADGTVECAVCHVVVETRDWRDHAMKKHYNVAWVLGATPIEINNPYGIEPCIKEYQARHNNELVCRTCGIHRVSAVGFYAHIITCGKTEEEQEIYKNVCEICNNKYLRIYKSQHMTMHREKEFALERKLRLAQHLKKEDTDEVETVGGRRKAAEKAKTVIEKYTSNIVDGSHCSLCGFTSEVEDEMKNHVCVERMFSGSDSDESVDFGHSSEEDDDSDVDSNISDEERQARDREMTRSRRHGDSSARIQRLPYQIRNLNTYMRKSAEEFAALHLTNEDLFPEWRYLELDPVLEEELPRYMPPLEESCKVRFAEDVDWQTYKRFEAKREKDITTMFTGACIQCICWVPVHSSAGALGGAEYLAVSTHAGADVPRLLWGGIPPPAPQLLQIWDCGDLVRDIPELVMGITLECGTIWCMDWCPSGARDVFDPEGVTTESYRLGLVAVGSSDGSAYVFAVPHPATIQDKNEKFYKLTPAAELRLATCSSRKKYQATAIKWSAQKGHAHIVVGYADGTTAYFDLKNESPMLKSKEKNVTVFYPYHDERAQSMCIEDVDVFPTRSSACGGVVAAGSVGGAGTRHAHAHAAAARVLYPPHWPAPLLAGDDNLVSQAINEVEWYGCGRRVGGMRACGACAWCGHVAALAAPAIRLLRTHPAYNDLHRQVIATLQMVPFGNKRKRKNDELSMIMEPLTYDDAITKYGIEFKRITAKDKNTQQKLAGLPRETYPERFPLADVTSMLFCPSARNHHKLAVATHAGLLFIINV